MPCVALAHAGVDERLVGGHSSIVDIIHTRFGKSEKGNKKTAQRKALAVWVVEKAGYYRLD